jgi:Tfp pilus assembly protein FimT
VRQLDADLRQARTQAITNNLTIRVEFAADAKSYSFYQSSDYGTTWTTYTPPRAFGYTKKLDNPVTVVGNTFRDINSNGLRDIVFQPNGTLTSACMAASGASAVGIGVPWTNVTYNRYSIEITAVGQVKDTASHS